MRMPALVEQTPGSEGRTLDIKPGASSIGCAPDCDLVLSSPGVAIHHAEGIYIRDLGSGFETCSLFVVTIAASTGFKHLLGSAAWYGFNPIIHVVTAISLMIEVRLLGLLYRTCDKRLGWLT